MTLVRGILLDFDGLVIDSEAADCLAWSEEFALAGVPLTRLEYAQVWHAWAWERQVRMIDHLRALAGRPIDEATIEARRLARYTALCANLPARPGIRQWIADAHAMGLTMGVATNDDTHRAPDHLARLGLDRYLDAVVTLQPGLARKPAPDLYLRALKLLDLDPATTIAVEDSSHGIEAAHRAGLRAIAYPTPEVSAHTDLSAADLVVSSAADTPIEEAIRALHG
jgi:putative hydrolase of the HAD superfamily